MAATEPDAIMFVRQINIFATEHEQARKIDQKLFGQMWANMSEDSINRVSRVHPVEEHHAVCRDMNAQQLLHRIRVSHQGAGALIPALNWDAASTTFYSIHQEPGEDIVDFKARFDASCRTMQVVGHPQIPNDAMFAVRFLKFSKGLR